MPRCESRNAEDLAVGDVLLMQDGHRVLRVALIEPEEVPPLAGLKFHLRCERDGSTTVLVCPPGESLNVVHPDLQDLAELNGAACADERRLWNTVKGKHPGQPGHDAAAWAEWADAARRVQTLGARLALAQGHSGTRRSPPIS